jgi:Asp-tRNA(Asn)/Glu-tRNA(Gln) amidotransferase A subunit family amidase
VTAGPDARDWSQLGPVPGSFRDGLDGGVAGLRVAHSPDLGGRVEVAPEVAAAVRRAVEAPAEPGARVEEAGAAGVPEPPVLASGEVQARRKPAVSPRAPARHRSWQASAIRSSPSTTEPRTIPGIQPASPLISRLLRSWNSARSTTVGLPRCPASAS